MFRLILSGLLFFVFIAKAKAKDIYVFEARRPLSLMNRQQLPKDFFINAGTESGLQKDVVVTVQRRQSLYDPYQNKAAGDIMVPVAELRIIYSQDGLSVARIEKMLDRTFLPTLDIDAILVGDRLDLGSAKKRSSKSAQVEPAPKSEPVYGPQAPAKTESAEFSSIAPSPVQSNVTMDSQTL